MKVYMCQTEGCAYAMSTPGTEGEQCDECCEFFEPVEMVSLARYRELEDAVMDLVRQPVMHVNGSAFQVLRKLVTAHPARKEPS